MRDGVALVSADHKKPVLAFVFLAVVTATMIGMKFRADALPTSLVAAGPAAVKIGPSHGTLAGAGGWAPLSRDAAASRPDRSGPRSPLSDMLLGLEELASEASAQAAPDIAQGTRSGTADEVTGGIVKTARARSNDTDSKRLADRPAHHTRDVVTDRSHAAGNGRRVGHHRTTGEAPGRKVDQPDGGATGPRPPRPR
jgi:hypothetical protein